MVNFILVGKTESFYYFRNLVLRLLASIWIAYNNYDSDKQLRNYLKKQQERLREDICWKELIDDFQDGVILVSKNKKISYKNNPVNAIFGLKEQRK
jgi:transcriptional regulator with PAS, ATPase and Fis domain